MFDLLLECFQKNTYRFMRPILSKSYRYVIIINNVAVTISVINKINNNNYNNNITKKLVIVTVTISLLLSLLSLRYLFRKLLRYDIFQ
jgi:hypothetical protein